MQFLAKEFGFNPAERRVGCAGHITNLVAKAVMLGGTSNDSLEAFEVDLKEDAQEERAELLQWRKAGPVGKLHNIVTFINRSPQRIQAFIALEHEGGHEQAYQLIRDNDTRWNSLFAMIRRALELREVVDTYIIKQIGQWHEHESRQKNQPRNKPLNSSSRLRPTVIDD
ncbi:Hypothetical protein D9617_87g078070 [Elsinoe fawcettii]|nr:Hypothetical protein D9617_87g078070 [Elsinoe fawcettii]